MTRRARALLILTAAAAAAVIFFALATLPPRAERLPSVTDDELARRTIPGAYHIHTTRSDGMADKAAVAAAARRAGLKFAIFTDHGDGTRPPDVPVYIDGVLCIDGVEISTDDGHYVALDMPASPYPLGGAAAAVVEDVARLGGFGIAAHPDSPKPSLRWRDTASALDGIEWLSVDSEWRDERRPALFRALVDYVARPAPAMASLLDRPLESLARWDALTRERPVVAIAAHDAHGGIGGAIEDGERAWVARVPSYQATFESMATRVILDRPPTGDASADARLLIQALRSGRAFTVIDAVAAPAVLDFRARSGRRDIAMGESAVFAGEAALLARANVPAGSRTVLLRDGTEITAAQGGAVEHRISAPGVYRLEVRAPRAPGDPPVPWLVSNPIYLRPDASSAHAPPAPRPEVIRDVTALAWRAEHDPASRATVSAEDEVVRLEYALHGGERASQFAALVADLPTPLAPYDAVLFSAEASAPMRVSVQLRFHDSEQRWGHSVYVDPTARTVQVPIGGMRAIGSAGERPSATAATALLFVIDLTNASPGTSGWLAIRRPALGVLVR